MMAIVRTRSRRAGLDVAVAGLAVLLMTAGTRKGLADWLPHWAIFALAAAQGLILLGRRRAPLAVLVGTTAAGAVMIAAGFPAGSAGFGVDCAAYAVAMYGGDWGQGEDAERPRVLAPGLKVGLAAVLAAATVLVIATVTPDSRSASAPWSLYTVGLVTLSGWVLGYAVRTRRAYIAELKARAARLEAEEGERAAGAVADERLRIARELHDVIGHSISLITVQAEAATRSTRTDPAAVPGFLATISAASREALAEMRHVLAVLRPDATADLSPQPGLEALPELVKRLDSGGLPVRLDLEAMELPPGVALAVYRIVQESLTNVLKHAGPGATASVTVARDAASVRVSVLDDGSGPVSSGPVGSLPRTGHGIVGMRERVAVYGGTLSISARPAGGTEVVATIPLSEEPA